MIKEVGIILETRRDISVILISYGDGSVILPLKRIFSRMKINRA